jgi:hypothetical protein
MFFISGAHYKAVRGGRPAFREIARNDRKQLGFPFERPSLTAPE